MTERDIANHSFVEVDGLTVQFVSRESTVHAVNGVNFSLGHQEILVLLGESGSGKTVTLRAMMKLLPPRISRIGGNVRVGNSNIFSMNDDELAETRGSKVAMIFQEPMVAFDPVYTVGQQITETIIRHEGVSMATAQKRAMELFNLVQIPSPVERLNAYPHEMSGGMRQRAMIALALSCRPELLLADEPTTALDATVQIQILLLLRELQRELGMAIIFVTHDVGVAIEIADSIAVMYAGRFIETGSVRNIIRSPQHPYTQGLLASTVGGSMRGQRLEAIPGSPPDLTSLSNGCSFAPRCRLAEDRCLASMPNEFWSDKEHMARCIKIETAHTDLL